MWEYITEENPKTCNWRGAEDLLCAPQWPRPSRSCNTAEVLRLVLVHVQSSDQWKTDTWKSYCKVGYVDMPALFRACHWKSNLLIRGRGGLVRGDRDQPAVKRMQHYKLKSLAIGQIHDSVLLDIVPEELQQIVEMYMDSRGRRRKIWTALAADISLSVRLSDRKWAATGVIWKVLVFYSVRHKEFYGRYNVLRQC